MLQKCYLQHLLSNCANHRFTVSPFQRIIQMNCERIQSHIQEQRENMIARGSMSHKGKVQTTATSPGCLFLLCFCRLHLQGMAVLCNTYDRRTDPLPQKSILACAVSVLTSRFVEFTNLQKTKLSRSTEDLL